MLLSYLRKGLATFLIIFAHFRKTLKSLIAALNKEKDAIKRNGIKVDGKSYTVSFRGKCASYL